MDQCLGNVDASTVLWIDGPATNDTGAIAKRKVLLMAAPTHGHVTAWQASNFLVFLHTDGASLVLLESAELFRYQLVSSIIILFLF